MRRRQVLAAVGGTGIGGIAGCLEDECPPRASPETPPDGWPVPGSNPGNTSVVPDGLPAPDDGSPGRERWHLEGWDVTDAVGAASAPVVDDEFVYLAYGLPSGWYRDDEEDGALVVVDESTGELEWEYPLGERASGAPALVGESVLIGDADGMLARLERASGTVEWERDLGAAVRTPAVADGWCYVQCDDGRVHAIDVETGERCWDADPRGLLERLGWGDDYETTGRPAVADGTVVVTTGVSRDSRTTGLVRALDRTSGERRWSQDLEGRLSGPPRSPAVADGNVYVTGRERLEAYALADGEREWTFTTGYTTSAPAVGEDVVYCCAKNVYAIDRDDGTERWRHVNLAPESSTIGGSERVPLTAQPAVAGGFVAVGFGALERTSGEHLWGEVGNEPESDYFHAGTSRFGEAMAGHAIANGALYAATSEGRVAKVVP
ncbi:outer membrane protein assembly factor BamB family protein [Halopiger goleimassiliensis]|uniref:outer membrane protein assembly factor BamB family protein n=1 Tax=Halopiger goleimassiliensis TaxID=1293048 RepID=UPI000678323A|nr:PQQ-binding-like beta-propeller repeat protein [Halopiger goleimassiliensis]